MGYVGNKIDFYMEDILHLEDPDTVVVRQVSRLIDRLSLLDTY